MGFLGLREDIWLWNSLKGFLKSRITLHRESFWLPLMLGYILNLSPFLEFFPFHFWGIHFDFLWPVFLDCFELNFSFALSLFRASLDLIGPWLLSFDLGSFLILFFYFFYQLENYLMDSNIGSHLAWGPCNHLTCPNVGGNLTRLNKKRIRQAQLG